MKLSPKPDNIVSLVELTVLLAYQNIQLSITKNLLYKFKMIYHLSYLFLEIYI